MANVLVTIRTFDDQAVPAAINGVLARIYDAAGTAYITEGLTGTVTPGEVTFTLFANAGGVNYVVDLSKSGVAFLPQPRFTITVHDPPTPSNVFTFTGHVGPTAVLVKFVVTDQDSNPVEDFRIRLFDSGDVFQTEVDTDVSGEATFVLEGDPDPGRSYIVRLFKAGYYVDLGPTQQISVHDPLVAPNTNIFDFAVTVRVPNESTDPNLCMVSGYLMDAALRPRKNVRLDFIAVPTELEARVGGFDTYSDPNIIRNLIVSEGASFWTDKDGHVEVSLPRGSIYIARIIGLELPGSTGEGTQLERVYIPDAAGAALEDVLFPYVTSVAYDPPTLSLQVDEVVEVELTVEGSNQALIEGSLAIQSLLEFVAADPAVALVTLHPEGSKLLVTGLAVGNTTIEVTRIAGTWAPRVPPISALVVTPAPVEVLP